MKNRAPLFTKIASNEEGFAIPIAIGMGLIMILLATTAIVRSQDDRTTAINKKATGQSLVAAESGIVQIQNFLNRYRPAAGYKACLAWNADGTCGDVTITTEASWKLASDLPTTLNATCGAESDMAAARATVQSWATQSWRQVDPADASKGEFKLLDYDGTGSLTIQGRAYGGQANEAISEVQVRVPLVDTRQEQVSSLWVKTSVSGSPQITSDVIGPCTGTMAASFPSGSDRAVLRTQMDMPAVPAQPSSANATNFYTLSNVSTIPGTVKTLPRTIANGASADDLPDANRAYKYIINSFDDSITITPGKSVWIWVTGNINIQNKFIMNQCSATGSFVGCGPFDLRIYGTGTLVPSGTTPTLTMNKGTYVCDTFFLLPTYSVIFNDTIASPAPLAQDCGNSTKNTGVYWVNTWSGGSSAGATLDAPRATWASAIVQIPPRIGPVQKWDPRSTTTP
jgi:hypothetical protein